MITSERLNEIEAAATVQPDAETTTLLEYGDGDVPALVLELVGEVRQRVRLRRIDESLESW